MSCRYTKSPFLYSLRRLKHVLWKESVMLRSSFTVRIFSFTIQLIKVSEGLRGFLISVKLWVTSRTINLESRIFTDEKEQPIHWMKHSEVNSILFFLYIFHFLSSSSLSLSLSGRRTKRITYIKEGPVSLWALMGVMIYNRPISTCMY